MLITDSQFEKAQKEIDEKVESLRQKVILQKIIFMIIILLGTYLIYL